MIVLEAGADVVHFDVMDNHFVPNLTIGPLICEALRDHGITAPIDVHDIIWTICKELDIGRVELAQLEAMLRAQRSFRKSAAGAADSKRVNDAYEALGIDRSSTNDEIKKAYRRLMNKNHPDKLASTNPDATVMAEAERRTREVRSAYDLLKARRSIR